VTTIGSALAAIILIGNASSALKEIDYWIPAHRGIVYAGLEQAEQKTQETFESLNKTILTVLIANLEITLRQLQERGVRLSDLLEKNPGDFTIRNDITTNNNESKEVQRQITAARCDLTRIDFPQARC
jgi:hypothetical protein